MTDSSYFGLKKSELQIQQLALLLPLEKALLSAVIHTLRLGVYLHQRKLLGDATVPGLNLDMTLPSAQACQKYIESALSSDLASDKLFPLRRTGPSMQYILQNLPFLNSPLSIFQLCIWRTFAFGNADYMKQLTLDPVCTTPALPSITSIIIKWGKGPSQFPLFAYGQLQIIKKNIPDMLLKLWRFAEDTSKDFTASDSPFTFADLRKRLGNHKISTVPHYGLISWVLTSDFYEYGVCLESTAQDLADHITYTNAAGAKGALGLIAEKIGEGAPDNAEDCAILLQHVLEILQDPPENTTISKVVEDCEKIQGRKLCVVDIEHALCKIARQNSRANARKGKGRERKIKGKGNESEGEGSNAAGPSSKRTRTGSDVGSKIKVKTEEDRTTSQRNKKRSLKHSADFIAG